MDVLWADSSLERVEIDYNSVVLSITESTGSVVRVRCTGHIAFEFSGFWDETIVEDGEILDEGEALARATLAVGRFTDATQAQTGSPERNEVGVPFRLLDVTLIDGLHLRCVARRFETERVSN